MTGLQPARATSGPSSFAVNSSRLPRKPVSSQDLQNLAMRDLSTSAPARANYSDGAPKRAAGIAEGGEEGEHEEQDQGRGSDAAEDSGADAAPHHVLIMKERQQLGSSATMARGAFLFSLHELCTILTEPRTCFAQ